MRRDDGPQGEASPADTLPALIGRLGEDLSRLVDSKLSLVKVELYEDARSFANGAVRAVAGAVVSAVGLVLVSVAVAFLVSGVLEDSAGLTPFAAQSIAFAATGSVFMGGGAVVAVRAVRRLRGANAVPERTVLELENDRRWLRPDG